MNYGIRISHKGHDVLTGDDIDMALTSKYALLKGSVISSGTFTATSSTSPNYITINHGYGYRPHTKVVVRQPDNNYSETPWYSGVYLGQETFDVFSYSTPNDLILELNYYHFTDQSSTWDFEYKYFIYRDKAII